MRIHTDKRIKETSSVELRETWSRGQKTLVLYMTCSLYLILIQGLQ